MIYYFSTDTGGFYTRKDHGDMIPVDAVEVSSTRHQELMDAQERGAKIVGGARGYPRAQFPSISEYRQRAFARLRAEAGRRIRAISPEWRQMNDLRHPTPEGEARFAAIDAIRSASNAIEVGLRGATGSELREFDPAGRTEWPTTSKGT